MALYGAYQAYRGYQKSQQEEELLNDQMKARPQYAPAPESKALLVDAQNRKNAVSPALLTAYRMAQQQAANTMAGAQRNATSGAEALAVGANAQNQFQSFIPQIAQMQTGYEQNNLNAYRQAMGNMAQERQMVFQDQLGRHSDLVNFHLGKMGAANTNMGQGLGLAASGFAGTQQYLDANVFGSGNVGGVGGPAGYGYNSMNPYGPSAHYGYFSPYMLR